jgi:hypothetical protein
MTLKLKAIVRCSEAAIFRHALEQLPANGSVRKAGEEFIVEAEMEGASARELNRAFLSALRKVEKRTTLRAEWTSDDGTVEKFFDYALKGTIKNEPACSNF